MGRRTLDVGRTERGLRLRTPFGRDQSRGVGREVLMEQQNGLPESATISFDVEATMRDGVVLRANVYRPAGEGPWPTLLSRLPYIKDDPRSMSEWLDPVQAVTAGFMVVVQDTRGCGKSDGDWSPLEFEGPDGYDSVEWAARLPGSNGRVGMYGDSYVGMTQWLAAIERPPSLGTIAPGLAFSDPLDGAFSRGGAIELGLGLPWCLLMGAAHIAKLPIDDVERERRITSILDDYDRLASDGYWDLPTSDMAVMRRHGVPDLGTFRALRDSAVVSRSRVAGRHVRVTVPSLHISGWYDLCLQGTLDNYMAMTSLGGPTRLVIGPWSHNPTFADPIGELCFGVRSGAHTMSDRDLAGLQLDWFRRHLCPGLSSEAAMLENPVRIFVLGRNEWRDEGRWPLQPVRLARAFLHPDGRLQADLPGVGTPPAAFVYDPADPAPTIGGNTVMWPSFSPGASDQTPLEARNDVCVFTSKPLDSDLEVIGRVRAFLHVASSAPSTDWVARLCDVHPDGRSFNVCDGILRVCEDASACRQVEIDLWSTSIVFLAGHRLRVHVTSSSFPRWDRNLNTGSQRDARIDIAHQRVYLDADHPSYLELPVTA